MNASDVFNSENKFFSAMNKIWDLLVLNFYFILTVILGIGPAATALYYAVVKNIRKNRSYATTEYFRAFRMNFKQGFLYGILQVVAAVSLYFCYYYAMSLKESSLFSQVYFALWILFTVIAVATSMYLYPILSRFTLGFWKTLRMAFILALRHLPTSIIILAILIVSGILVYVFPPAVLFIFGLYTLLKSFLMEKVLRRYTPKPEEGDETTDAWYLE